MYKLKNNFHERFKDANWYKKTDNVLVGGAGGIGSWLTLYLARAGFNTIKVVDFDRIEEHNMSGQLLKKEDIDELKIESLKKVVLDFTDVRINGIEGRVEDLLTVPHIVLSGFDNMQARKALFEKWLENKDRLVYIDGRLAFDTMHIYTVQNKEEDIQNYYETLYSDANSNEDLCTLKQTSHIAGGIAFLMTVKLLNVIDNLHGGTNIVPFKQVYNTSLDNFIL